MMHPFGADKPVKAKDLKVGHRSFSYGTVIHIEDQGDKIAVEFDSNTVMWYEKEREVR